MAGASRALIAWTRDMIGTPANFVGLNVRLISFGVEFAGTGYVPSIIIVDDAGMPRWYSVANRMAFDLREDIPSWAGIEISVISDSGCILSTGEFRYWFTDYWDGRPKVVPTGVENAKALYYVEDRELDIYIKSDGTAAWFDGYGYYTSPDYTGGDPIVDDFPVGLKVKQICGFKWREGQTRVGVLALGIDGAITTWGDIGSPIYDIPAGVVASAIATGGYHALALKADGSVVAWGDDTFEQCQVPTGLVASKIFAGDRFSGALREDGTVVMWGEYPEAPPGLVATDIIASADLVVAIGTSDLPPIDGGISLTMAPYTTSFRPPEGERFVEVSAARYHALGLKEDGTVYSTGADVVPDGLIARKVLAFDESSAAITPDGHIVTWGEYAPAVPTDVVVADAWCSPCGGIGAILADNTVVCYGCAAPPPGQKAAKVAVGGHHVLALQEDGTVVAWGKDYWGEMLVPDGLVAVDIAAGLTYSAALKVDGTVVVWGKFDYPNAQSSPWAARWAPFDKVITEIYGGSNHIVGKCDDGTIVAWGSNTGTYEQGIPVEGQCDLPAGTTALSVAAGYYATFVVNEDQTVRQYGFGNYYLDEIPEGLVPTTVSMGGTHILALDAAGRVWAWGNNANGQCDVPPGLVATKISAGERHSMALGVDGSVYAWGDNSYDQCNVPEGLVAVEIHAAVTASYAILANGDLVWFGTGTFPETGHNMFAQQVSCSDAHGLVLRELGVVSAWGSNDQGECNVPPGLRAKKVVAGAGASIAIDMEGHLVEWGRGLVSENRDPNTKFIDVSVRGVTAAAVTEDHELVIWWYEYVF